MEVTFKWHKFLGLPKWSPEIVPAGLPELWTAITPDCRVRLQWGLNQSCSPHRYLFKTMLHSQIGCREEINSWLLVVGSQIVNLTLGASFAHNLGCKCPNYQCEAIFDIYVSRPFQWNQEHLNSRCFGPFCWALNIRESRRTPNPQLSKCWASPPHLAKVGLRQSHSLLSKRPFRASKYSPNNRGLKGQPYFTPCWHLKLEVIPSLGWLMHTVSLAYIVYKHRKKRPSTPRLANTCHNTSCDIVLNAFFKSTKQQ